VGLVQDKEIVTALLVNLAITSMSTTLRAYDSLLFAAFKAEHLRVQIALSIAVSFVQCAPDVSNQLALDDIQGRRHIPIQLVRALADGILDEILEERSHLCDITAANRIQKVIHSGLQCGLHFQGEQSGTIIHSQHTGQSGQHLHLTTEIVK
jgi:hypothetical protein